MTQMMFADDEADDQKWGSMDGLDSIQKRESSRNVLSNSQE